MPALLGRFKRIDRFVRQTLSVSAQRRTDKVDPIKQIDRSFLEAEHAGNSQHVLFVLLEIDLVNVILRAVVEIVQHEVLPGHVVDDVLHFLAKPVTSLRFLVGGGRERVNNGLAF